MAVHSHALWFKQHPATFARLMEVVLAGLPWNVRLLHLDDILVHEKRSGKRYLIYTKSLVILNCSGKKFFIWNTL